MFYQGFLKPSVWLYVDQSNRTMAFPHPDNTQKHMLEAVTEGEASLLPSLKVDSMFQLRSVGHVEISDEATLEDLKTQVEYERHFLKPHHHLGKIEFGDFFYSLWQMLTLPALLDVCLPSAAFMRVWQLEGQRVVRILRGKQHTLRLFHFRCAFDKEWRRSFDSWPRHVLFFFFPPLIRKLKLSTGKDLCVQQLVKEEDLG